ncbi:VENN motif pre-toxin domain-containing protein [Pantoea ananatis]|uniref:VENN motif pre-toxin domain-containing protein n=1 Tax=Pantoea ananas TaxID=553 RepID=UPI003BB1B5BC
MVRDQANQKQDTATLSRDTAHANDSISPIFNKEKEQQRLQTAQMIGEIGSQVADIARTQGEIYALKKAQEVKGPPPEGASEKARNAYIESLKATPEYKKAIADSDSGTGSSLQQGIQAATAAVQGLAGGDFKAALAGASAPYLAELIHKNTTTTGPDGKPVVNTAANLMAHAVVGAVIAQAQGNSALSGVGGAALGEFIAQEMYPGIARTDLSEEQKQTISALGTLAAGLAGGLANGSASGAIAGAQAGKNAVENNALGDIAQAQSEGKTVEQKAVDYVEAENERYKKANCVGMSAEACSVKMYTERREALKDVASTGADFVPVVGTIKSAAEAQSALDYLYVAASLIPGERVAAGMLKAAEKALTSGDVAEASKLVNKASDEIATASRPSHRQSEIDVGKDLGNGWREQVSFKDGKEVPYGTKGGVRPDWCQGNVCSVEVKNYNITNNQSGLISNVSKQAIQRAENLPAGMQQRVIIDVRGQSVSLEQERAIIKGIVQKSNGAIDPAAIEFKR